MGQTLKDKQIFELHPDYNTVDMMQGLIKRKKLN